MCIPLMFQIEEQKKKTRLLFSLNLINNKNKQYFTLLSSLLYIHIYIHIFLTTYPKRLTYIRSPVRKENGIEILLRVLEFRTYRSFSTRID